MYSYLTGYPSCQITCVEISQLPQSCKGFTPSTLRIPQKRSNNTCAPLTITTLTTNTVFVSSTLTLNNTVTSTAFATTSSLSTYTPTNTVYAVAIDTVTVTPTLTRHAISIVKRKTIVVTTTNTRTKSVYPRHPPGCAMPTVN